MQTPETMQTSQTMEANNGTSKTDPDLPILPPGSSPQEFAKWIRTAHVLSAAWIIETGRRLVPSMLTVVMTSVCVDAAAHPLPSTTVKVRSASTRRTLTVTR